MPTDQNRGEQEEYRFIQEKVVPNRRKKWKKILSSAGMAVIMGGLFGAAATAVFCLSEPWLAARLGQTEQKEQSDGEILLSDGRPADETDADGDGEDVSGTFEDGSEGQEGSGESTDGETDGNTGVTDASDTGGSEEPGTDLSGEDGEEGSDGNVEANGNQISGPTIVEQRIEGDLADFKNMYHEISQMAAEVSQSIVEVSCVTNGIDWFQNPYETEDETSGLILAADEKLIYILVNYERIGQASEIRITFEQSVSATASFRDADTDVGLAVVTVKKSDLPKRLADDIQTAPLGESYSLELGEPVMALGNPTGFQRSMLLGMITNREDYAYVADSRLSLFHTDMPLSESGEGFIVNMDGRVVGVITRSLGKDQNICTALAISKIKPLLEKMMNRTPRIYLGIIGMDLPETLAEKLEVTGGVYVSEVESGSPAAQAGIRSGDVILQAGEHHVFTISALSTYLQEQAPGDVIALKICRMVREDAVTRDYEVTLVQKDALNR